MAWNKVAVVGAGLIKMGELFEQSYEQMASGAFEAAVASVDKGFEPHQVEAAFVAPLPIVVLDMDDGARLMLQAIGDGTDIEIGRSVELVLRKYAHERGVPVYGFKARAKKEAAS